MEDGSKLPGSHTADEEHYHGVVDSVKVKNSTVLQYFKEEYGTKLVENPQFDKVESVSYSDSFGVMLVIRENEPLLAKGSSL